MAEGLGVLHTKSSYVTSMPILAAQPEDIKLQSLMGQIASLKSQEIAFANKFGYGSVEEMIKGIREILQGAPNDMKALQQFSSNNLRGHLEQFKSKYGKALDGQKIRLTFTTDKTDGQLQKILDDSGGNGTITWSMSGNVEFNIQWNPGAVKQIVNRMRGTHFQHSTKGVDNIVKLREYVLNNAGIMLDVVQGKSTKSMETFLVENTSSPFGLTKDQVKNLEKTNRPLLVEFSNKIKNFIYNEICAGASGEFKKAVQSVMGQKIQQLSDITFFMGGNGWITHAVGAFGELQTAVMFQYIANKVPNKTLAGAITSIVGDDVNGYGQQLHTDLEIFNALGIQVKNYNGTYNARTGAERTVDVHLHPYEVAALGGDAGVADYIINSYFNTSIPQYPEGLLNDFLESHASELLNLNLNPTIPDQVNFYMIGSNFIPGSVILQEAFQKATIEVTTGISGASKGSDESFNEPQGEWHRPFHEWWRSTEQPPSAGAFEPTGQNSTSAWNGRVSIQARFTYSALFDGTYSLF